MSDANNDPIRDRAYEIWQAEGSPEGRHEQHWQQAASEIAQARDEAGQAGAEPLMSVPAGAPGTDSPETAAPAEVPAAPRRRKATTASATKARSRKND